MLATGLVAGGALMGVVAAILVVFAPGFMSAMNLEEPIHHALGDSLYQLMGTLFFVAMALYLYKIARGK